MAPRILMVDNYDSFTFNLVQSFSTHGAEVMVYRNDQITPTECETIQPSHLVISPGPGRPENAGVSLAILEAMLGRIPILGVCLGHQCLVQHLGGDVIPAKRLMHGKASTIQHDGRGVFATLPNPMTVGRYHSLSVQRSSLPDSLESTASTQDGEIMAVRHKSLPAIGVQFHPESILTPDGDTLLLNFLRLGPEQWSPPPLAGRL